MKKALLSVAALAMLTTMAWAGVKSYTSVFIDSSSRFAYGELGAARNSADPYQMIGCSVWAGSGTPTYVYCSAADASNNQASCASTSANFARVAESISGDSHVSFYWDAAGNCTQLISGNYSFTPPKQP